MASPRARRGQRNTRKPTAITAAATLMTNAGMAQVRSVGRRTALADMTNAAGVPRKIRLGPSPLSGWPQQNNCAAGTPPSDRIESSSAVLPIVILQRLRGRIGAQGERRQTGRQSEQSPTSSSGRAGQKNRGKNRLGSQHARAAAQPQAPWCTSLSPSRASALFTLLRRAPVRGASLHRGLHSRAKKRRPDARSAIGCIIQRPCTRCKRARKILDDFSSLRRLPQ